MGKWQMANGKWQMANVFNIIQNHLVIVSKYVKMINV